MSAELDDDHVVAICRVLQDHDVAFVIIGGIAARLHDTGHATVDVDICPSRDESNLTNLALALRALGTRLRVEGDPDGVTFDPHPDMLRRVSTMTLITAHGPLDLCFTPAGFADGYPALQRHAVVIRVADTDLPVASLDDVVASKRAAGRPKDIVALPALEAHLRRFGPTRPPD
jgi:hypothetical protein